MFVSSPLPWSRRIPGLRPSFYPPNSVGHLRKTRLVICSSASCRLWSRPLSYRCCELTPHPLAPRTAAATVLLPLSPPPVPPATIRHDPPPPAATSITSS
ncbi:unnamed protein product [Rangifer tarandus platyrhynchus]|uniref:Uncharacterized protein n=1 Tax=Rangifer tarandus platyrhynchus TaxID=3082113 RepID=A0AC59ZKP0_RANTA